MKTLDDRIVFTFHDEDMTLHSEGTYPFILKRNPGSLNLFAGNFYYNGTDTALTFDVTDIIASDGFVIREDDFDDENKTIGNKLVNRYYITILWDEDEHDTMTSVAEYVAKVHKYRNRDLEETEPFFDTNVYEDDWKVLVQGDMKLTPHYPMYSYHTRQKGIPFYQSENICPFAYSLLTGNHVDDIMTEFSFSGYTRTGLTTTVNGSYSYTDISTAGIVGSYTESAVTPFNDAEFKLGSGYTGIQAIMVSIKGDTYIYVRYPQIDITYADHPYGFALVIGSADEPFSLVDYNNVDEYDYYYADAEVLNVGSTVYKGNNVLSPLEPPAEKSVDAVYTVSTAFLGHTYAIFDVCPKKYYLFWQDRYGSFQCQAFNDHAKYSEKFTRTEIKDYRDRTRNAYIQVESKWELNSGWIPESLYPYYESIYTSPILILFDSERNKKFSVMVSGDYLEKTYKNQKKMINMNLELTENKKQNIIY